MTNGPLFLAQECMAIRHKKRRNVEINKVLFPNSPLCAMIKISKARWI